MSSKGNRRAATWGPAFDIYLSGPISSHGSLKENFQRFEEAAAALRAKGYRVFSPPEAEPLGLPWQDYMRRDIRYLSDAAMVVTLPNWRKSRGARVEVNLAKAIGMQVITLEEALSE